MKITAFVGETFESFNQNYHAKPTSAAFLQECVGIDNVYVASSATPSSGLEPQGISTVVADDHFYPFPHYTSTKDFVLKTLFKKGFYKSYVSLSEDVIRKHEGEFFWIRTPSIGSIVFGLTVLRLDQKLLHHMCADASNTWKDNKYKGFNKVLAFCFSKVLRFKLKEICRHQNTINLCTGDVLERFSKTYSPNQTFQFVDVMIEAPINALQLKPRFVKQGDVINLLFVGRVVDDKGVFDLIDAVSRLNGRVKATIVGDGPDLSKAKRVVNERKLDSQVVFLGQLPHKQLNQLYEDTDLVVVPSNNNYEGFPRVIMEAWSNLKPVIVSNVGGVNAFVKEGVNGFIFEPGNVDALTGIIASVVTDVGVLSELEDGVREMSIISNKEYWVKQVLDIIETN
ncbi:glycosyltransferase [uncultured Shewanella sp.]|uniref:glycosyltransferase n=1 Tax=uncultured Shewanella sp. TaxID=173975 RepID=UPI00260C38AA|nr:glycosyltransferase [uncultured Shewanella sp.]